MIDESNGYIIPFAKVRGETSFASLEVIKRVLKTKRVGHTGTLDAFADGLLVVLSGKITRIASLIEEKTKQYEAHIAFGLETDTLDIFGKPVFETSLPFYKDVCVMLKRFVGDIMQVPPQFSALHVGGCRASDMARAGKCVGLLPRSVHIDEIEVKGVLFSGTTVFVEKELAEKKLESMVQSLHVRITCAKGTYIRALARDIGRALSSSAHLKALRRVSVGIFSLERAFGCELLPEFLSEDFYKKEYNASIEDYLLTFSTEMCEGLGFFYLKIKEEFEMNFLQGKKIKDFWFYDLKEKRSTLSADREVFIFCESKVLGAIEVVGDVYKYRIVF